MEFSLEQLAGILGGTVEGDSTQKVYRLDKIQEGQPGSIAFLANAKYESFLYETAATAVIVSQDFVASKPFQTTLIRVKDAYTGFTTLLEAYQQLNQAALVGVEEPSYLAESSSMGENGYRGAFSYIGKNCILGKGVKIYGQAYIGDRVKIGDGTVIHAGAKIYNDTLIGKQCVIHSGAIIGSDGFGFAPQADGTYKTIPQVGNVILEDQVSIGANSTIDRATMGSTLIRKGVKIDNQVHIAHNVVIGENTVIAAQTGISGSTEIGKNCVLAGKVGIAGHLKIADHTTIGGNTGINKSIKTSGKTLFGFLAMDLNHFLRSYSVFKNLDDLQKRIQQLEKKG
ncbi:MAG: UDP-3-O-(3-hydroxymyristoyl)glucosamine N-acyltransferase [Algoriphagus sp.]|nr:UDP-3-O-(3-hydroxymyristoyl)glucosamine N-acyltransferase [Algoriphagus sp.]MCE2779344.1 UDP-3-O-(3-hydroxymyristoyl)glucosamine N-acyltransferase [Algoriphagus sp.]